MRKFRTRGGVLPQRPGVLEFLREVHPRGADPEQPAHVAGSESVVRTGGQLWARRHAPELAHPGDPGGFRRLVESLVAVSVRTRLQR